ncbi:IS630 family transposase [Paludisphaera mucosa]|uniref:IS630 family transposase n=1 Tax=Paludisphaera mucosa TaxID=3030827 RepID=A0ABT6FA50_9BACT|nr:IS630 family transposase [Paludisphaera mucosa]MDG3004273.1 IS630 family transposase [Paludisphaera mucosa]
MALKDKRLVRLTDAQRAQLEKMTAGGRHAAAALVHARILLKADVGPGGPGWGDAAIAEAVECSEGTVARVRKRFAEGGFEAAVHRRKPTGRQYRKLDGAQEARLVALACSAPPDGKARWTLKMLADRLVEVEAVDAVSDETVRRVLKKTRPKPWLKQQWVIPPKADAEFVRAMEGVLEVYARPHGPRRPVVCVDEGGKRLIGEARPPPPTRPGSTAKEDYEYVRHGMADLFMAFEPLAGRRRVEVTERKTKADFARLLKRVADEWHPEAERVALVMDNLSTHRPAVLYEAFEPAEARRILGRLEFVYTPKHGSWLNVAECELSVLARQRLDRRIPDMGALRREVAAWEADRNAAAVKVDWQFTTADARVKLKRLYPALETVNSGVADH